MLPQSLELYFRVATSQRIVLHHAQISASFKACTVNFCTTVWTGNVIMNTVTISHLPRIDFSLRGFFNLQKVKDDLNEIPAHLLLP